MQCIPEMLRNIFLQVMCEWEQTFICAPKFSLQDLIRFQGKCRYDCVVNEGRNVAQMNT